jgi:hypothetical protein
MKNGKPYTFVITSDMRFIYIKVTTIFAIFIDCVYSREETIAPAEIAHRSITIAHLGNIAMMLETDLEWDPVTEKILNNELANNMLARPMREPWASVFKEFAV